MLNLLNKITSPASLLSLATILTYGSASVEARDTYPVMNSVAEYNRFCHVPSDPNDSEYIACSNACLNIEYTVGYYAECPEYRNQWDNFVNCVQCSHVLYSVASNGIVYQKAESCGYLSEINVSDCRGGTISSSKFSNYSTTSTGPVNPPETTYTAYPISSDEPESNETYTGSVFLPTLSTELLTDGQTYNGTVYLPTLSTSLPTGGETYTGSVYLPTLSTELLTDGPTYSGSIYLPTLSPGYNQTISPRPTCQKCVTRTVTSTGVTTKTTVEGTSTVTVTEPCETTYTETLTTADVTEKCSVCSTVTLTHTGVTTKTTVEGTISVTITEPCETTSTYIVYPVESSNPVPSYSPGSVITKTVSESCEKCLTSVSVSSGLTTITRTSEGSPVTITEPFATTVSVTLSLSTVSDLESSNLNTVVPPGTSKQVEPKPSVTTVETKPVTVPGESSHSVLEQVNSGSNMIVSMIITLSAVAFAFILV